MAIMMPVPVVLRVSGKAAGSRNLNLNLARKKREWTQWRLVLAVQGAGPGARQEGPGARRHWCHWQSQAGVTGSLVTLVAKGAGTSTSGRLAVFS